MRRQRRDIIISASILIIAVSASLGMFLLMTSWTDRRCKEQFGQEWSGRYRYYSPDICINDSGEAKYPR